MTLLIAELYVERNPTFVPKNAFAYSLKLARNKTDLLKRSLINACFGVGAFDNFLGRMRDIS